MDIYKSMSKLLTDPLNPLDLLVNQSMLFGTKRAIGPFPSSVQFGQKMRGCFGFDQFGPLESLSDPRCWQNRQAMYDLEREYMMKSPEQSSICMISFTSDTNGDTSKGEGWDDNDCKSLLDLNDPRVQERYYDPYSERGFNWVTSVKHEWDSEDVFHSRFTVPPKPFASASNNR